MSFLLCLETATKNCSVSIFENDKCISLVEKSSEKYLHAELLNYFIQWSLEGVPLEFKDLSAIIISSGPGSYTGLRIGVASAKAFCFSLNIPLISVDTLTSLARTSTSTFDYVIPCLDARRDEIYCAVYDENYQEIVPTQALVLNLDFFKPFLEKNILLIGDGAQKTQKFLESFKVNIQENLPTAETLGLIGYQKYIKKDFEDIAYFEPSYLKKFVNNIKK